MKTITTIGSGYSGSSAVYDYLKSLNLFFDPFPDTEFSITYDPGGIMDIESIFEKKFSLNQVNIILKQFKKNIIFYKNDINDLSPGVNIIKKKKIYEIFKSYYDNLIDFKYGGQTIFLKHNDNNLNNIKRKIFQKFSIHRWNS